MSVVGAPPAGAESIWQLAVGFGMAARAVQTACLLGVFDGLVAQPQIGPVLAQTLGVNANGLEAILVACTALGVLERSTDGRYRNSALASTFLRAGVPGTLHDAVRSGSTLYTDWVDLPAAVRSGQPLHSGVAPSDDTALKTYLDGVFQTSWPEAVAFAEGHDWHDVRRVLDVGGGTGAYALALARRWSDLRVDLLEREAVVPFARDLIRASGLASRINVLAGDYHGTLPGATYDLTLLMNVLHQESADNTAQLVTRAARTLGRRGRLAVQDICLNETASGPAIAALLGLNVFLQHGGHVHSVAEVAVWIRNAHLETLVSHQRPTTGFTTLIAHRPDVSDHSRRGHE